MLHAIMDASCTAAHWSTLPGLPTATQQQTTSLKSQCSFSQARRERRFALLCVQMKEQLALIRSYEYALQLTDVALS